MNQDKIIQIIASVLEVNVADVNISSSTTNIESWDSMKQLFIVSELEQEFNIEYSTDEMEKMKSVETIVEITNRKLS